MPADPLTPLSVEQIAPLAMFEQLEVALYGKSGNTWELQKSERVFALLRHWSAEIEALRSQVERLTKDRDHYAAFVDSLFRAQSKRDDSHD
jgi:hypothetical protein